jgi:phenylacetate-CoA ligase
VEVDRTGPLTELHIDVEPTAAVREPLAERIGQAIQDELLFRAQVRQVPPGTLPRFEMKARRMIIKEGPKSKVESPRSEDPGHSTLDPGRQR